MNSINNFAKQKADLIDKNIIDTFVEGKFKDDKIEPENTGVAKLISADAKPDEKAAKDYIRYQLFTAKNRS